MAYVEHQEGRIVNTELPPSLAKWEVSGDGAIVSHRHRPHVDRVEAIQRGRNIRVPLGAIKAYLK
jgi:hypothetical protein